MTSFSYQVIRKCDRIDEKGHLPNFGEPGSIEISGNFQKLLKNWYFLGVQFETLRKTCPYSELFWSVFSRIWTEHGEILRISPYLVGIRENTNQNNSEYGHFLRSKTFEKIYLKGK